jgi:hypothetical protein
MNRELHEVLQNVDKISGKYSIFCHPERGMYEISFNNTVEFEDIEKFSKSSFSADDNFGRTYTIHFDGDKRLFKILIPLDAIPVNMREQQPRGGLNMTDNDTFVMTFEWMDLEPQEEAVGIYPNILLEYEDDKLGRLNIFKSEDLCPLKN